MPGTMGSNAVIGLGIRFRTKVLNELGLGSGLGMILSGLRSWLGFINGLEINRSHGNYPQGQKNVKLFCVWTCICYVLGMISQE